MDEGFGHWLAGFVDGEACFEIRRVAREGGREGHRYNCVFRITLRDDDRPILEEIQKRLGCGGIHQEPFSGEGNRKPAVSFSVGDKRDCLHLVEVLDDCPLRAKKRRDFAVWREAVIEVNQLPNANTLEPRDTSRLDELCALLPDVRKYGSEIDLSCLRESHLPVALAA